MKNGIKQVVLITCVLITANKLFLDKENKPIVYVVTFALMFMYLLDYLLKCFIKRTLIKLFVEDDTYQRPEWVRNASNFFLSLFCALFINSMGVNIDFNQGIKYNPQIGFIENKSFFQLVIYLALCAVFVNIFWIAYVIVHVEIKKILNGLKQINNLLHLMALLNP